MQIGARRQLAGLTGLLLAGERKSVEPMAAKVNPEDMSTVPSTVDAPFRRRREVGRGSVDSTAHATMRCSEFERHGPVAAWVVDEHRVFQKKASAGVAVARQYCGVVGKEDNCQVVVTVSLVISQYERALRLSTVSARDLGR